MRRWLTLLALCLLPAALPAAPPAPTPVSQVDLAHFGLTTPPEGQAPNTAVNLLLITNDRLIVLLTHLEQGRTWQPADLFVIQVSSGAILQHQTLSGSRYASGEIPGREIQRLSPTEFALAVSDAAFRCNLDLQCRDEPLLAGQLRVSTDGNLLLLGTSGPGQNAWLGFDRHLNLLQRYRNDTFSDIPANPFGTVLSTDASLRFLPTGQTQISL